MIGTRCVALFLCILVIFGAGCQKQGGSSSVPGSSTGSGTAPAVGAATPEEMFARASAAEKNQDWSALFECYAPNQRDELIFGAIFGAFLFAREEEQKQLEQTAKQHGVAWKDPKEVMKQGMEKGKVDALMGEMLRDVKDKRALFVALFPVLVKAVEGRRQFDGELSDLKIVGDKAEGKVTRKQEEGKRPRPFAPVKFAKHNGGWYLAPS
jgi:hypothetical protein